MRATGQQRRRLWAVLCRGAASVRAGLSNLRMSINCVCGLLQAKLRLLRLPMRP